MSALSKYERLFNAAQQEIIAFEKQANLMRHPYMVPGAILGTAALAGVGGGYLGDHLATSRAEEMRLQLEQAHAEELRSTRNKAFGAGMATGTAVPTVINRAGGYLERLMNPQEGPM